jgi:phage gp45-like
MRNPIAAVAHLVTDLVFGDDTVTATGWDDDDELELVPAWQFGFQSRPSDGAGGVVLRLGGNGGLAFVLSYRKTQYEVAIAKKETRIHNEITGCQLLLDKDGHVNLGAGSGAFVKVGGDADFIALAAKVDQNDATLRSAINMILTHTHQVPSIQAGTSIGIANASTDIGSIVSSLPSVAAQIAKGT